jgi:hypothetical protein
MALYPGSVGESVKRRFLSSNVFGGGGGNILLESCRLRGPYAMGYPHSTESYRVPNILIAYELTLNPGRTDDPTGGI